MSEPTTPKMIIDAYIAQFPKSTRVLLEEMREIIKKAIPDATEAISYGMPAFKLKSTIVWYAGYAKHIGLYPTGAPIAAFEKELKGYKTSKGTVQFPLDKTLPVALIQKIVLFRLKQAQDSYKK